jgi:DNA-binding Lrp family transcriptional regulator
VADSGTTYRDEVESVDRQIVHALQLDGRAAFARIAEVIGVSEHTVARRYRRLRADGAIKVVGVPNPMVLGHHQWTIRLRCTPDVGVALTTALARRTDTFWVHLLSGGTEISCYQQVASAADLLLDKLPRTSRVLDVSAHSVLRGFVSPGTWTGVAALTDDQAAQFDTGFDLAPVEPVELDHVLMGLLARNGRMGFAELAARADTSESTARRRVELLRRSRTLGFMLETDPRAFGYLTEARLWMSVRPSGLAAVGEALTRHPEVYFAAATTGQANLVASVTCRDSLDLYRYLTEQIGALDGVTSLESAPVLRTVKRTVGV